MTFKFLITTKSGTKIEFTQSNLGFNTAREVAESYQCNSEAEMLGFMDDKTSLVIKPKEIEVFLVEMVENHETN